LKPVRSEFIYLKTILYFHVSLLLLFELMAYINNGIDGGKTTTEIITPIPVGRAIIPMANKLLPTYIETDLEIIPTVDLFLIKETESKCITLFSI
jgi:hypothetical protein